MSDTEITEAAVVELTRRLVEQPSPNPPGEEAAVADLLAERLRSSPVEFAVDRQSVAPGRENLVARAGDPAHGSLLLTGHTDTVPADADAWDGDPYRLRREGDRLVGRGTADMKGALAATIVAAESFLDSAEPSGEVVLGFVADEENSGDGTVAMIESGVDADAAVLGEPSGMQPAIASYGYLGYTVTVSGESGHSGRPDRSTNAIDGLRRVLNRIETLAAEVRETTHPVLDPGPSISVTGIEGGIAPNVVPDRATATVTWRTLPFDEFDPAAYDRRLERAIGSVAIRGSPVDVTVERGIDARPAAIDADEPVVEAVIDAAAAVGRDCEPVGFNAGSDARFLVGDAGIPTVHFGPGTIEDDAHTVGESVAVDDLVDAARIYRGVLDRSLRVE